MKLSLKSKTILGTALIEGALLLLLIFVATRFFTDILNENLQKRAETTSSLFATMTKDAVLSYDLASLDAFLNEVLKSPDITYARVLDADGEVFAQKGQGDLLSAAFKADTDLDTVDDGVYDSFAQIAEGDELYGRVELGISIDQLQLSLNKVNQWVVSIAAIEMLLVAMFSWFLGAYLTGQLQKLTRATKRMQKSIHTGDFSTAKVDIRGKDEVGQVADAFNDLVAKLDKQSQRTKLFQEELQSFNVKLEQLVDQRTEQLATKNSELQQTFDELKTTQQQLVHNEKMASVGQLAAGLAHEINNPVGFIKSNLSSLEGYTDKFIALYEKVHQVIASQDAKQRDALIVQIKQLCEQSDMGFVAEDTIELHKDIKDGLTRVIDIIKNMSVFSRVDSNEKQMFNINRCIETTTKMVKKNFSGNSSIQLILGSIPESLINVGKINQVLTNLIVNAGHAVEDGGKVIVKTKYEDECIKITVADTGKGIAKAHLDKIFDPFFTTKAEGKGTGLGLSISFDIIQEHEGELSVNSKEGKGTVFSIVLPVLKESALEESTLTQSVNKELAS